MLLETLLIVVILVVVVVVVVVAVKFSTPPNNDMITPSTIGWAEHVSRMGEVRNGCWVLVQEC